jgi:hypothetical protein
VVEEMAQNVSFAVTGLEFVVHWLKVDFAQAEIPQLTFGEDVVEESTDFMEIIASSWSSG